MTIRFQRWTREPVIATAALVAIFLTIHGVAGWGIVSGRRSARQAAESELELRTRADARSLEAILASLRGDFLLIARSEPLASFRGSAESTRRGRRPVESTLLLFLKAHPEVERLQVEDAQGRRVLAAARHRGSPVLLARGTTLAGSVLYEGRFELPSGLVLRAGLDPLELLEISFPGRGDRLRIDRDDEIPPPGPGVLTYQTPVTDERWEPPIAWWLVRHEPEGELLRSAEILAERYRLTVVLNLTVMSLTLVLGVLALRQVRRAVRLEAENEQARRVRELERQLVHSERLASVGRLAAGLAHEINNPLEGMSNYLALLADDLGAGRTDEAPRLVERVREGLRRAAGITRQVLTFSARGRASAPKDAIDLATVLREAAGFVRSSREYRGVDISLEIDGELTVTGNPITLGQLFLNLLLNACQLGGEGGRIEVRAAAEPPASAAGRSHAVVRVADRGPGLSDDVLVHLFEPFFSTRDSTGLGLAVCHGIVQDHGGEIEGRNRDGGGAVFEVRLPMDERWNTAERRNTEEQ